jgi:hypothetical protein
MWTATGTCKCGQPVTVHMPAEVAVSWMRGGESAIEGQVDAGSLYALRTGRHMGCR